MNSADFKHHREAIGWTQKQAAEGLGLSVAQISAIENGRSAVTATVQKLFKLYQLGDGPDRPTAHLTAQRNK